MSNCEQLAEIPSIMELERKEESSQLRALNFSTSSLHFCKALWWEKHESEIKKKFSIHGMEMKGKEWFLRPHLIPSLTDRD